MSTPKTGLGAVLRRELRYLTTRPIYLFAIFGAPLLVTLMLLYMMGGGLPTNMPVAVVDEDHTPTSRALTRSLDAFQSSEVALEATSMPEDFDRMLMSGRQAHVDLHATFVSALYYKAFSLATTEVALTMGREIEAERHHGPSSEATRISVRPIESEWVVPYNPQGGFQGFLLPGVLVLIIQQTLLIGIAMMSGTQRERGGLSTPVQYVGGHYVSVMRLLVGRAICYFTLYSVTSLFTLVVAPWLFGLPQLTDFTTYVLLFLPMLLAMIFFSLGCSLLTRHREKAMILWVFTSVPFLFLTGLSWPLSAIPGPLRALGYLIPSTPGVQAFVAVSSMGAQLSDILPQYLTLWVQALVYFLITSFAYARVLRRS